MNATDKLQEALPHAELPLEKPARIAFGVTILVEVLVLAVSLVYLFLNTVPRFPLH